jgi:hypothetical protein
MLELCEETKADSRAMCVFLLSHLCWNWNVSSNFNQTPHFQICWSSVQLLLSCSMQTESPLLIKHRSIKTYEEWICILANLIRTRFTVAEGYKFRCGLDSRSRAGVWPKDWAGVRAVRTLQGGKNGVRIRFENIRVCTSTLLDLKVGFQLRTPSALSPKYQPVCYEAAG